MEIPLPPSDALRVAARILKAVALEVATPLESGALTSDSSSGVERPRKRAKISNKIDSIRPSLGSASPK